MLIYYNKEWQGTLLIPCHFIILIQLHYNFFWI